MKLFAGNFTLEEWKELPELDFDTIKINSKNYFIMWWSEELSSSQELLEFLENSIWRFAYHDISIDGEDSLEILAEEYPEEGSYECVSFEWPNVEFHEILERFAESTETLCIRECEESKLYGNRIVRVDFLF